MPNLNAGTIWFSSLVSISQEYQKLERDDLFWSLLVILPYTHPKQKKETCVFFRAYL